MFEKVLPNHPDKVLDRIGGAIVDYAYMKEENPRIAGEGLIGHGKCHLMLETSVEIPKEFAEEAVERIAGPGYEVVLDQVPQDAYLAENQDAGVRCGDNGIFKGMPLTLEQVQLTKIAKRLHREFPYDGKCILDGEKLIICQSNAEERDVRDLVPEYEAIVNPLGFWTGSPSVDSGAVNRKLGSDMGDSVTGGGLHFKDLSKADVSVNIFCFLMAQKLGKPIEMCCAIGDTEVGGFPYERIVGVARKYIKAIGGFERFAEWGLVR